MRELDEQVLLDGGQFERSPMYHQIALEDVLDLLGMIMAFGDIDAQIARLRSKLTGVAERMLCWSRIMVHEDGTLPRFNDTSDAIGPSLSEIERVAEGLGICAKLLVDDPVCVLPDSGYIRLQWAGAQAFLDVAAIGPDYLPGHAHADTLSFELSVQGRRVVVNRGTSCYGISARRSYERGTAAHSTVQIGGMDSSETWGGFRVGRRARPLGLSVSAGRVICRHDGYRFLMGRPQHVRSWERLDGGIVIDDLITQDMPAIARYHLAPGLSARQESMRRWRIVEGDSLIATVDVEAGDGQIVSSTHAEGFGQLVAAETLEVALRRGRATVRWLW